MSWDHIELPSFKQEEQKASPKSMDISMWLGQTGKFGEEIMWLELTKLDNGQQPSINSRKYLHIKAQ